MKVIKKTALFPRKFSGRRRIDKSTAFLIRKAALLLVLLMAIPFEYSSAAQKPEKKAPADPPPLTEEEKEILKDREILENLGLLQNFDKLELYELFAEPDMDSSTDKKSVEQAAEKDTDKKK
jgi:hypothetical protein